MEEPDGAAAGPSTPPPSIASSSSPTARGGSGAVSTKKRAGKIESPLPSLRKQSSLIRLFEESLEPLPGPVPLPAPRLCRMALHRPQQQARARIVR